MGVWLKNNVLFVSVVRARGLALARSATGEKPNPYVKTYLLPDGSKHTKRKTGIQRKTTNPEFNEILKVILCILGGQSINWGICSNFNNHIGS